MGESEAGFVPSSFLLSQNQDLWARDDRSRDRHVQIRQLHGPPSISTKSGTVVCLKSEDPTPSLPLSQVPPKKESLSDSPRRTMMDVQGESSVICSVPPSSICSGCGLRILDRFYIQAVEKQWHDDCLRCHACGIVLSNELTCFARDGVILCKEDYSR